MNVNPRYIETSPDKVVFKKALDDRYTAIVNIHNLTDNYVLFQIFLNKQSSYSVLPAIGFIEPYNSTEVIIRHIEERLEVSDSLYKDDLEKIRKKDKFLIKAIITNKQISCVRIHLLRTKKRRCM